MNYNRDEALQRTAILIGKENVDLLKEKHVIVFGVGGVGGFAVEALVRSGVGEITIVDNDKVSISNLNRQIIATIDSIGKDKVDVMEERIKSINPECIVNKSKCFLLKDNINEFDFKKYDYIVDCIDTVTGKIALVEKANELNVPIISSMGTGNKLDPTKLEICDIYKTSICPLARVMRYELRKRNIEKLKVVYSKEQPIQVDTDYPGSVSFVPSTAGLIIASAVIKDLIR